MAQVKIHDFRILDRVLAETEPDAGDVVFLGAHGQIAFPFVCARRISGPGGTYIDAIDIIDADGRSLGVWEKRYELDGESKPRDLITELRGVRFPQAGTYMAQYSVFDDVVANFSFTVVQREAPAAGIVPGPLDAALAKSTIVWVTFDEAGAPPPERTGRPVKLPVYENRQQWPVWYGYSNGQVYVLVGEGEQQVPGLLDATAVHIVARSKDVQSRVAEAECAVERLDKGAEWDRIARDLLIGRRLNLHDGDAAIERWRTTCEIVVLTPLPPPVPADASLV